jgi:endonuclease YncB( thermonuclease family)
MGGGGGAWRSRMLAGVAVAAVAGHADAADPGRCQPVQHETAAIRAALDGRTLRLADGREVRLIGLEVPDEPVRARAATVALAGMVDGRDAMLARLGEPADRHGRLLALVSVSPAGSDSFVQRALIAQGHARMASRVGDQACAGQLLQAERAARAAKLGLWADPEYVIKEAANPGQILAGRGTFTLVEGQVLSVREAGGTIYLNFGRRWSEDFTVTVPKRSERMFAAAGLVLKDLAGRRVRVRGFIEERGGPWIEAARPEQIEMAERD